MPDESLDMDDLESLGVLKPLALDDRVKAIYARGVEPVRIELADSDTATTLHFESDADLRGVIDFLVASSEEVVASRSSRIGTWRGHFRYSAFAPPGNGTCSLTILKLEPRP